MLVGTKFTPYLNSKQFFLIVENIHVRVIKPYAAKGRPRNSTAGISIS